MDLTFRIMDKSEAFELEKLAKKSFGLIEGIFVTRPKTALVAILDEKIIGGFVYQIQVIGSKKIGYISFLFTDPAFHRQGVGKRLCDEGFRHLWKEGCNALATVVRDDNAASWGIFVKNGFVMASLTKMISFLGFLGIIKLCLKTTYGIHSIGHDFYIALNDENSSSIFKKEGGIGQIIIYILINILLVLPIMTRTLNILSFAMSSAFIFLGIVLAGYIGTLFSKQKWSFRFTSGGGLLYLAAKIIPGFFIPLIGGWYPLRYENTSVFRRDMAINVIVVWIFLLGIVVASVFVDNFPQYLKLAPFLASVLLVLKCLPIPVFESTGFGRVFKWNKIVFLLLATASILFVYFPHFLN